jgi:hypothetical protein
LQQVFSDLVEKLRSYEVDLAELHTPQSFARLNSVDLVTLLLNSPIVEEADRRDCLQALHNTQDIVASLIQHLRLLNEIETHLNDWLWGLISIYPAGMVRPTWSGYKTAHMLNDWRDALKVIL